MTSPYWALLTPAQQLSLTAQLLVFLPFLSLLFSSTLFLTHSLSSSCLDILSSSTTTNSSFKMREIVCFPPSSMPNDSPLSRLRRVFGHSPDF